MSRHAVRLEGYNAILYQPPPNPNPNAHKHPYAAYSSPFHTTTHIQNHHIRPLPCSKLIAARLAAPVSSSTSALTQRPVKVGTRHLARKTQTKQRQGHFKSEGCGGKKGGDVDEKPWMGNQINCFGLALPPHHRHCVSIFGSFAVGGTWFLGS